MERKIREGKERIVKGRKKELYRRTKSKEKEK